MNEKYLRELKSTFTKHYQLRTDIWSKDEALRDTARKLKPHLPKDGSVLDIGAGRGNDCLYFLEHGHPTTGIDIIKNNRISKLQDMWPTKFTFYKGSFQKFPAQQRYDGILDNGCFHHQSEEDQVIYLTKAYNLLKPGGHFCMNVYTPKFSGVDGRTSFLADGRIAHVYSEKQIIETVTAFQFQFLLTERVESSVHAGTFLIVLCKK